MGFETIGGFRARRPGVDVTRGVSEGWQRLAELLGEPFCVEIIIHFVNPLFLYLSKQMPFLVRGMERAFKSLSWSLLAHSVSRISDKKVGILARICSVRQRKVSVGREKYLYGGLRGSYGGESSWILDLLRGGRGGCGGLSAGATDR